MITKTDRKAEVKRRHIRVRRKISGTAECPRLCVYRSNNNLFAQIIDDVAGTTLVSCSTLDKAIKTKHSNKEAAKEVGSLIAKKALEKNIKTIVFDRSGYVYHGVIKELAEAAREAGLEF
jgi:large subunit ribosomal protein L18